MQRPGLQGITVCCAGAFEGSRKIALLNSGTAVAKFW